MAPSSYVGFAGIWSMDLGAAVPRAESSFSTETTAESIFDPDYRSLVDENDYKDGGKYRSIVKLQMRYEKQSPDDKNFAMGTGWLIRPDLLVTAGHNVYSWSGAGSEDKLGRAVHIKCYVGYHGRDSLKSPIVQCRLAKNIVTTAEWLTGKDNRHRDVAFIQVDRPFEGNLRVFSYKATPKIGDEMIGVVGYPADKSITDEDGREEKGALMYEQFNDIQYNLEDPKNKPPMLKYRISTFGGQSGAPVIRKNAKQVAIATHVYGGGDKNQASVIGKLGNDYDVLLNAFSQSYPSVGEYEGIKLVNPLPGTTGAAPANELSLFKQSLTIQPVKVTSIYSQTGAIPTGFPPSDGLHVNSVNGGAEAEGFIDSLKAIGRVVTGVGKVALPFVSPLLGPAGGPISAIAGAALGAVGNVCSESFMDGSGPPPSLNPTSASKGSTERAILAEASLQAVLKMDNHHPLTVRILGDMQKTYTVMAPNVKHIAPKLAPGLLNSAYRITVEKNYIQKNTGRRATLPARPLKIAIGNGAESAFASNDFIDGMLKPTKPLEGEESFFDGLGSLINTGLKYGKPLLREGAKLGFQLIDKALAESSFDAESAFESHDVQAAELVAKRAVMGEAALQAIMKLKTPELEQLALVTDAGDLHEESCFDFIKNAAQKIGAVVSDIAPSVIGTVLPIVVDAVTKKTGGSIGAGAGAGAKSSSSLPTPVVRKKKSVLNMINDGTLKVSALGPPDVLDALVRADQPARPSLRRVDSNQDKPVFQEL